MAITEKEITICGHGSGTPSTKNMWTYLESRYQQKASNGLRKGAVAVVRRKGMTDDLGRAFSETYKGILGRNVYSQNLRTYVYSPYSNGKYYSDCSSSGDATFTKIGLGTSWLNTVGMYTSALFEKLEVKIQNGHIQNPEILQQGDAILFAGNDPTRLLQIGHVEYVYHIPASDYPKWVLKDGKWYYYLSSTEKAIGWREIAESRNPSAKHWYYFKSDGSMTTGWFKIGDKWFYAEPMEYPMAGALYHESDKRDGSLEIWTF